MKTLSISRALALLAGTLGLSALGVASCVADVDPLCGEQGNPVAYCASKSGAGAICTDNRCPGVSRIDHGCVPMHVLTHLDISSDHACLADPSPPGETTDVASSEDSASMSAGPSSSTAESSTSASSSSSASADESESSDASSGSSTASSDTTECTSDAECIKHPNGTLCNLETSTCVQCLDPGSTAGCDPAGLKVCNEANLCVACVDDMQCAGTADACLVDPADSRNNACVDCTQASHCPQGAPICEANACRGCTAPAGDLLADCRSAAGQAAACVTQSPGALAGMPQVGECLSDLVLYVGSKTVCSDTGTGAGPDAPFCTIGRALTQIKAAGPAVRATVVLSAGLELAESVALAGERVAIVAEQQAVLADATKRPKVRANLADKAALAVGAATFATVSDIDFIEGAGDGVSCSGNGSGAALFLRNATVRSNFGRALHISTACAVHGDRVEFSDHRNVRIGTLVKKGGSATVDNSSLYLVNSMIAYNTVADEKAGLLVRGTSQVDLSYTTLAWFTSSGDVSDTRPAIRAEQAGSKVSANGVVMLLVPVTEDDQDPANCPSARCSFSASVTNDLRLTQAFPLGLRYVESLMSALDSRYRFKTGSALVEMLKSVTPWQEGDPLVDLDGKVRPLVNMAGYPGASVP